MGYQKTRRVFNIVFDDPDSTLCGLEIRCRALSFGRINAMVKENPQEDRGVMVRHLLESAFGWNMEDDGEPVELSAEAINDLEFGQVVEIYNAWADITAGNITAKKERKSSAGSPSEAASIPMEPLSPSRAS